MNIETTVASLLATIIRLTKRLCSLDMLTRFPACIRRSLSLYTVHMRVQLTTTLLVRYLCVVCCHFSYGLFTVITRKVLVNLQHRRPPS